MLVYVMHDVMSAPHPAASSCRGFNETLTVNTIIVYGAGKEKLKGGTQEIFGSLRVSQRSRD